MPSYLDFDATKKLRDEILAKTLQAPNGPQTFSTTNYSIQNTNSFSNKDQGDVVQNAQTSRTQQLTSTNTSNAFGPQDGLYNVQEQFDTYIALDNFGEYPYFNSGADILGRSLISAINTQNYEFETKLAKFANYELSQDPNGPVLARIQQNLEKATLGKVRLLDALNGNTSTAINIVRGRENIIEKNYKITVAKTIPGKAIDFLQTVAGVQFPWSEIPGQYLTDPANPIINRPTATTELGKIFQDATGALGSLLGIQRRPTPSRKPSDLMIEYLSDGQKSILFDNLKYSTYAPNYTTTAMSQNTSKLFNFADKIAAGINKVLGQEAPKGKAYIGDDRGNDVKYTIADFNDNKTRSPYYLSLLFDETATRLFHEEKNISERGTIPGKLTWYSINSKNPIGKYNTEFQSERSNLENSLSTKTQFRSDSILAKTQALLNTLPKNGGESRTHVANVIDQTSRVFKEGDTMMSRGSAIRFVNSDGQLDGSQYCRVWTKDRSYMNYSDTMKKTTLLRKYDDSVLSTPWNLNIAPMSNGKRGKDAFKDSTNIDNVTKSAKKYMFSIENLAWKTSNKSGFTYQDLPYCERGPNGGRIMWFPPYDIKINETNAANWERNNFIGRPEPIYTYQNTERSGTLSFKVVVDHPSILNLLIKDISDDEAENYINAFFAGCKDLDFYDLVRKYTTLDRSELEIIQGYLDYYRDGKTVDQYDSIEFSNVVGEQTYIPGVTIGGTDPSYGKGDTINFDQFLYFPNDVPRPQDGLYSDKTYGEVYSAYTSSDSISTFNSVLNTQLTQILTVNNPNNLADREVIYGKDPTGTTAELVTRTQGQISEAFQKLNDNYTSLTKTLDSIKEQLTKNNLKSLDITIESSTSFVADDKYNIKLSYRRSDSIIKHVIKTLHKNNEIPSSIQNYWKKTKDELNSNPGEVKEDYKIDLKDLGYGDDVTGEINIYFTNKGENSTATGPEQYDCHNQEIKNTGGLKKYAPVTFYCRSVSAKILAETKPAKIDGKDPVKGEDKVIVGPDKTDITVNQITKNKKPPMDVVKMLIAKTLSECFYFKKLEETDPVVFGNLKDKLKYFHPAFHSMTPEGLNTRLTFLQQCIRPGDTVPIKGLKAETSTGGVDARNTTFGPPPICVLRIGDFYHSKIVITNLNIQFENSTWDLNPEGIGVQPMLADVTLQINFIGGQGIKEPVAKLQNALSSNFYANTEMYDYRSDSTASTIGGKPAKEFNIDFLEKLLQKVKTPTTTNTETSPEQKVDGVYIGTISTDADYTTNRDELLNSTNEYFAKFKEVRNNLNKTFGNEILPLFISPTYRSITKVDVNNTAGSSIQIDLFGNYKEGLDFANLFERFDTALMAKASSSDHNIVLDFDITPNSAKYNRSRDIIDTYITGVTRTFLDSVRDDKSVKELENSRNKVIQYIDGLNFIMSSSGKDAKFEKDNISVITLTDFNDSKFYEQYDEAINLIKNKHSMFTDNLDSSVSFASPTISDDLYYKLLAFIIKDNADTIKALYLESADDNLFDKNTVNKIERRVEKFIKNATKVSEEKFKFKEVRNKKEFKPYEFTETGTLTSGESERLEKIHSLTDTSDQSKLNFSKVSE